jgi:hypothetical protein
VINEPEDKTGGEAQDEEQDADQDRPTVTPPFDPVAFAQHVLGGRPSPAKGMQANPTPKAGRSTAAKPPRSEARPPTPTLTDPAELEAARQQSLSSGPRPTPKGVLSLANARVPSNLPPRPTSRVKGGDVADDRKELATSPPPPMQQALIDAMAYEQARPMKDPSAAPAPLAATAPPAPPPPPSAQEMNDRVSLGDYTGALEIAEKLLASSPDDEPIKACAETCRGVLKQMYTTRIGPLDRVPLVMVAREQLRWLSIDHRAGFVLSLVDGVSSLEMILDVSGMPELDALRILSELAQQRIISFR